MPQISRNAPLTRHGSQWGALFRGTKHLVDSQHHSSLALLKMDVDPDGVCSEGLTSLSVMVIYYHW